MPVVRISIGRFDKSVYEEVEHLLIDGQKRLVPAIEKLPGCLRYEVGISPDANTITNVSIWDTLEHAVQMTSLQAMQNEGILMRSKGVRFDPIINYEVVWEIVR